MKSENPNEPSENLYAVLDFLYAQCSLRCALSFYMAAKGEWIAKACTFFGRACKRLEEHFRVGWDCPADVRNRVAGEGAAFAVGGSKCGGNDVPCSLFPSLFWWSSLFCVTSHLKTSDSL